MAGRTRATRGNRRHHHEQLPLDVAQECFTWLVTGPDPLSLDGRAFAGLPNRAVPLDEVRDRMLRRRCPRRTRDAIWAELVRRSRAEGATWTLACTGMALPALAGTARALAARYPGEAFDVHAEVLTGFLTALARIDLSRPRVLVRLRWAAYRAGHAALAEALDAPTPVAPGFRSAVPRPPWGHPDLVLAEAVGAAVLTATEADLIGATRLEGSPVADWAAAHDTTAEAAYKARRRAEHRLLAYLREHGGEADSGLPEPVSTGSGRPPRTLRHRADRSQSVTAQRSGASVKSLEKSSGGVSKKPSETGLLQCGGNPPAAPSTRSSSEVPRCA